MSKVTEMSSDKIHENGPHILPGVPEGACNRAPSAGLSSGSATDTKPGCALTGAPGGNKHASAAASKTTTTTVVKGPRGKGGKQPKPGGDKAAAQKPWVCWHCAKRGVGDIRPHLEAEHKRPPRGAGGVSGKGKDTSALVEAFQDATEKAEASVDATLETVAELNAIIEDKDSEIAKFKADKLPTATELLMVTKAVASAASKHDETGALVGVRYLPALDVSEGDVLHVTKMEAATYAEDAWANAFSVFRTDLTDRFTRGVEHMRASFSELAEVLTATIDGVAGSLVQLKPSDQKKLDELDEKLEEDLIKGLCTIGLSGLHFSRHFPQGNHWECYHSVQTVCIAATVTTVRCAESLLHKAFVRARRFAKQSTWIPTVLAAAAPLVEPPAREFSGALFDLITDTGQIIWEAYGPMACIQRCALTSSCLGGTLLFSVDQLGHDYSDERTLGDRNFSTAVVAGMAFGSYFIEWEFKPVWWAALFGITEEWILKNDYGRATSTTCRFPSQYMDRDGNFVRMTVNLSILQQLNSTSTLYSSATGHDFKKTLLTYIRGEPRISPPVGRCLTSGRDDVASAIDLFAYLHGDKPSAMRVVDTPAKGDLK